MLICSGTNLLDDGLGLSLCAAGGALACCLRLAGRASSLSVSDISCPHSERVSSEKGSANVISPWHLLCLLEFPVSPPFEAAPVWCFYIFAVRVDEEETDSRKTTGNNAYHIRILCGCQSLLARLCV